MDNITIPKCEPKEALDTNIVVSTRWDMTKARQSLKFKDTYLNSAIDSE